MSLPERLNASKKVSIVCARGLGDALLSMILAHNLSLSGYQVTTFSSVLCQLREWFPNQHILPYPSQEHFFNTFSSFDTVIAADHSLVNETHLFGNELIILKESDFNKKTSMVENLQAACKQRFALSSSKKENGIKPLRNLKFKAHPNRIILHPTSADENKNWPAVKFIALAERLEKEGYFPYFCVSPAEREKWTSIIPIEKLPLFPTVSNLASFIYESGYLIGNDSGVGHLASALNIPTLSIFARSSYAKLWRPGWSRGHVATPKNILFGARLKQKYWKRLLSVSHVHKAFIADLV